MHPSLTCGDHENRDVDLGKFLAVEKDLEWHQPKLELGNIEML